MIDNEREGMERTLRKFLEIKKANSLTSVQSQLFGVRISERGWYVKCADITLSEPDWAKALDSLKDSTGKFNCVNTTKKKQKLYLASCCDNLFKIGISIKPRSRVGELQTGNPFPIQLLCVWECAIDTFAIEQDILHNFKEYSMSGEWMRLGENGKAIITAYLKDNPSYGCKSVKL